MDYDFTVIQKQLVAMDFECYTRNFGELKGTYTLHD